MEHIGGKEGEEMAKRICPLLMVARGGVIGAGLCNCVEELCAWYVKHYTGDGECALREISASMIELNQR